MLIVKLASISLCMYYISIPDQCQNYFGPEELSDTGNRPSLSVDYQFDF